jgi:hypothetical protein
MAEERNVWTIFGVETSHKKTRLEVGEENVQLKLNLVLVREVTRMGKTGLTRKPRFDINCGEISYYTFR